MEGKFIAIIGMDGTGKTTVARALSDLLKRNGFACKTDYPEDFLLLRHPIKWLKSLRKKKPGEKNPLLRTEKKPFFLFRFFPLLSLADHWLYYRRRIKPALRDQEWVVCERYFYNFFISYEYYRYSFRWLTNLCVRLLPRPDLTILLDAPPARCLHREEQRQDGDQHDLHFFRSVRGKFLRYKHDLNFLTINTDIKSPEETIGIISRKIPA